MRKNILVAAGIICAGILCLGCRKEESRNDSNQEEIVFDEEALKEKVKPMTLKELGSPMEVDNVLSLTLDTGGFYDICYPYNAHNEDCNKIYAGEGEVIFGLYGMIENMSSKKFCINDIADVTITIDDEYEYKGYICLENDAATDFLYVSEYSSTLADTIQPKAEKPCVLFGRVGEEVAIEASTVTIVVDVKKSVDGDEDCQSFLMKFKINQ